MTKQEISKIMLILQTNYSYYFEKMKPEELETLLNLYEVCFKDYDYQTVANSIMNIINKEDYFPPISRIKREIAEMGTKNFPKAEDEWNIVLELVSKYGTYRELDALNEMKDYTRYIVKHIGFVNICMADSEQQKWNRKEFIEEYNNLKDKQKELIQIGHKEVNVLKMLQEHNENKENE